MTVEIKAAQIETWSDQREAQDHLPVLVRRLIKETLPQGSIQRMDFPGYENVSRPGFDGQLCTIEGRSFVPCGKSVWELGTGADPKGKFMEDLGKREDNVEGDTTFVFVSSRNWRSKDDCVQNAQNGGWKEVLVYDASDLEQWIEDCPATKIWFGETIGFPTKHLENPKSFLWDWMKSTSPEFPGDLLFSNRLPQKKELTEFLLRNQPGQSCSLIVDTREEAIAFIGAVICGEEKLKSIPAVIVKNEEGVDGVKTWLNFSGDSKILISKSKNIASKFSSDMLNLNTLIIAGSREDLHGREQLLKRGQVSERHLRLVLPRVGNFHSAFPNDPQTASTKYTQTGGSLSALHRICNISIAKRDPKWLHLIKNGNRKSIFLALAGGWDESFESDKKFIMEFLNLKDYREWVDFAQSVRDTPESPIEKSSGKGQEYRLFSRIDAFLAIAHKITDLDIKEFFGLAEEILTEDRVTGFGFMSDFSSAASRAASNCSYAMRHGIVEGLIILNWQKDLLNVDNFDEYTSNLYSKIFEPGHSWVNLSDVMPRLAEASPEDFLTCLKKALADPSDRIKALFAPEGIGNFYNENKHASLLQALQMLAWSEGRLFDVLNLLCDIQKRFESKIRGKFADRPSKTLHSILRPWHPQTSADSNSRNESFLNLYERYPEETAQLALAAVDITDEYAGFNSVPVWRDEATYCARPSSEEISDSIKVSIEILARYFNGHQHTAAQKAKILAKLLESIEYWCSHISDKEIDDLVKSVRSMPKDAGNGSTDLYEAARSVISGIKRRRGISEDLRARSAKTASRIQSHFRPNESAIEVAYLFSNKFEEETHFEFNYDTEKSQTKINKERQKSILCIYSKEGLDGIVKVLNFPTNYHYFAQALHICRADLPGFSLENYLLKIMKSDIGITKIQRHIPAIFGWDADESSATPPLQASESISIIESVFRQMESASENVTNFDAKQTCLLHAIRLDQEKGREYINSLSCSMRQKYFNYAHISRPMDRLCENEEQTNWLIKNYIEHKRPRLAWISVSCQHISFADKAKLLIMMFNDEEDLGGVLDFSPDGYQIDNFINEALNMDLDDEQKNMLVEIELKFFNSLHAPGDDRFSFVERKIGESPEFFMRLHKNGYKNDALDHVCDPLVNYMGEGFCKEVSYKILSKMDFRSPNYPWISENGDFSGECFGKWLLKARELAAQENRIRSVDYLLGAGLIKVVDPDDDLMPDPAVIELLEGVKTKEIFSGFTIELYNARGGTTNDIDDRGYSSAGLQTRYEDISGQLEREGYRFVSEIFSEMAVKFREYAEHEREFAEHVDLHYR